MKTKATLYRWLAATFFSVLTTSAAMAAKVGENAPVFTGKDIDGKTFNLSDAKGKFVVLEWHNQGCPYVVKHYDSGNMQRLQKDWMTKGVTWIKVISSAPGKQGYVTAAEEKSYLKKQNSNPTSVILDSDGVIGKLYAAKTTPHMFIIDPNGKLIYNGAIDSKPTSNPDDIKTAKNYIDEALNLAMAGKSVAAPSTTPYGCSTKYKD